MLYLTTANDTLTMRLHCLYIVSKNHVRKCNKYVLACNTQTEFVMKKESFVLDFFRWVWVKIDRVFGFKLTKYYVLFRQNTFRQNEYTYHKCSEVCIQI